MPHPSLCLPACSASRAARARPTGTRPDEVAMPAKCGQLDPRMAL
jgi:hypothetical protein